MLYNRKRHHSDPGVQAKLCPKRKISQIKLIVWWSSAGVNHYSFLQSGDRYRQEMQIIMEKLAVKHPRLVNCSSLLLLHGNAPKTLAKVARAEAADTLSSTILPRTYTNRYHLFRSLDNFFQGKNFNSEAAVKNSFWSTRTRHTFYWPILQSSP